MKIYFKATSTALILIAFLAANSAVRAEQSVAGQTDYSKEALDPRFKDALAAKSLRLIKGQPYAVCQDILANINLLPDPAYARGDWPVSPRFPLLSKPDWLPVSIADHKDVVRRILTYNQRIKAERRNNPEPFNPAVIEQQINSDIAGGGGELQMAKFDFDHDGYKDDVFRYSPQELHKGEDARKNGWMPGTYWQLAVNSGRPDISNPEADHSFSLPWNMRDVFLYDGRAYVLNLGAAGNHYVTEPFYSESGQEVFIGREICEMHIAEVE